MTIRQKGTRMLVLITVSLVYLANAFRIGFWITGDMHSGGPWIGVVLFPLFASLVTTLLYWQYRRVRSICALIIGAYVVVGCFLFLFMR